MFFFFIFLVIGSEPSRHISDYEGSETSYLFSGPMIQRVESCEKKPLWCRETKVQSYFHHLGD